VSKDLGETSPPGRTLTMGFKECYLVPKELYEKQHLPADVRLKQWDYKKRFQSSVNTPTPSEDSKLEQQMQSILGGIPDVLRRNLASQILTFIVTKGGSSIRWTDDFVVLLDNQRLYNLDIREALRHLVGVSPDIRRETYPIYERLLALGIKPNLLMFYDEPPERKSESEEDWDDNSWEDAKEETEEKKHPMTLRHKTPKWETYRI